MKLITIILLSVITQTSFSQIDSAPSQYWRYADGYTTKQLILKNNSKFHWYFSSCEGSVCYSGKYKQKGDSLILFIKNTDERLEFVFRKNNIYTYKNKENKYSDFEPLSPVGKEKRLKCKDEKLEYVEYKE